MTLPPRLQRRLTRNRALLAAFQVGDQVRRRPGSPGNALWTTGAIEKLSEGVGLRPPGWQRDLTPEERDQLFSHVVPRAKVAFRQPIRPNCKCGLVRRWVALSNLEHVTLPESEE